MAKKRARTAALWCALLAVLATIGAMAPSFAEPPKRRDPSEISTAREVTSAAEEEDEGEEEEGEHILARAEQASIARTAPAQDVSAAAFRTARRQARRLPVTGGTWNELTDQVYQNDAPGYRDPVWSNSGAGWFQVTGRMSALAASRGVLYAGAADGGVWKSTDKGKHWTPWSRGLPRLSIGSLAVNHDDHSIWVGLGEANTAFENFKAEGVFRLAPGARRWQRVGGDELFSNTIYRLRFDGRGHVYAATNRGLYRRSSSGLSARWIRVLKPDPNPTDSVYRTSHITDVVMPPGSRGKVVLAVLGWRGGTLPADTRYNGFYVSRDGGAKNSFRRITPRGDIDVPDIGRTTFVRGGQALYAIMESPGRLAAPDELEGFTNLQGVFVSRTGSPRGPWRLLADAKELAESGSAMPPLGIFPGLQSWYNQYIEVDPNNPKHIYAGLEEVYESLDGGRTWKTIGRYWNFLTPCYKGGLHDCPMTTHPDQHAITFSKRRAYMGGDGGIYSRRLSDHRRGGWKNLNADLHTLQYYYAGIGSLPKGDAIWGGLQDNGVSLLRPEARRMVSPFGGDGGDTLVDPDNGNRAVVEYVNLDMALTTNGGRNWTEITPSCGAFTYTPKPCDPLPRFIAPFRADVNKKSHWVAGGEFLWESRKGWNTRCAAGPCDWKRIRDTGGPGASTTAIAVNRDTIYAAWCFPGSGCNPGQGLEFDSGIDTNYGGRWHTVNAPNLPNRYINQVTVDPKDPAHVYAVYGAFSRRWIPGAGVGHVFESSNGGRTWRDISGNLPDIPADDLLMWKDKLVLATDSNVYIAERNDPSAWTRFGRRLPKSATWDLTPSPDGSYIVAATHGRGLWSINFPR